MIHSHTPKHTYSFQAARLVFNEHPHEAHSPETQTPEPVCFTGDEDKVKEDFPAAPEALIKKGVENKISMEKFERGTPSGPSFKMSTTNQPTDVQTYDKDGKLIGAHADVESATGIEVIRGLSILHTVPPPTWEFKINGTREAIVIKNPKYDWESTQGPDGVNWLRLRTTVTVSQNFLNFAKDKPELSAFQNLKAGEPSDDFIMERINTTNGTPEKSTKTGTNGEKFSPYSANYVLYHASVESMKDNERTSLQKDLLRLNNALQDRMRDPTIGSNEHDVTREVNADLNVWYSSLTAAQRNILVSRRENLPSDFPDTWIIIKKGGDEYQFKVFFSQKGPEIKRVT